MTPARAGNGEFVKSIDTAKRRQLAAEMRSHGASWKQVADKYYRGNLGNANQGVKQWWAEQPKETVEEIRSTVLAKLDGIEQLVRATLDQPHYVVAEGRIIRDHLKDCPGKVDGDWSLCVCPKLIDTKPVLEAADRLMKVIEQQTRVIPGLAAPSRVDATVESTVSYVINATPDELEQL